MAELRLEQVTKRYARGTGSGGDALRGVDLVVPDGALTVLVGPSGSGKTTLLRVVAGLEPVTRGVVRLGGAPVNDVPPGRRNVALVFQDFALYPEMTVRGNLEFAARFGVAKSERRERVESVIDRVDLRPLLDRHPAELSGGERQRVAVGRALVREARCILYDEPLSSLDAARRDQVRDEIVATHARCRTTTVYVTHDQEEAMAVADRVAVIDGGRIRQEGTPESVYTRPADRFVAAFLGAPTMNFIDGRITGGQFEGSALRLPVPAVAVGDRDVVLGVRPTELELRREVHDERGAVRVESTRFMGSRTDVQVRTSGGVRLRACVRGLVPTIGEMVSVRISPAACHLFEPGPEGPRIELAD